MKYIENVNYLGEKQPGIEPAKKNAEIALKPSFQKEVEKIPYSNKNRGDQIQSKAIVVNDKVNSKSTAMSNSNVFVEKYSNGELSNKYVESKSVHQNTEKINEAKGK